MASLKELCKPRNSVFDKSKRDVVLDLTDLIENKIDPQAFFEENFRTDGMKQLLTEAFRRFSGQTDTGVITLTQAMGGGKTHSMIALGLLAQNPDWRKKIMGDCLPDEKNLEQIRVVAFSGRESDYPLGIWGAIADQLGKRELFKDYYSPLSAPGQSAWVNLLKGKPLLILLDELPPYLDSARAKSIGNSDLAAVTTTALSNLLVAVGKQELQNVCVVISDLTATYESGSQQLAKALNNLRNEVSRSTLYLTPVRMNTDEIYQILRTRLFEKTPEESQIKATAQNYAKALHEARQMDITNKKPEDLSSEILISYPFHPAIRDLYARFKENPGFQQTRGLIRLMRVFVASLFSGKNCRAEQLELIHPFDFDLNDPETLAEISHINPSLTNAISHDIASQGQAVAEILDDSGKSFDAQDLSRLILIASLPNVPNAVLGLSPSELAAHLCSPKRDLSRIKETLGLLTTKAWYIHSNRDGKIFFKNVQNLVAKLKTMAESLNRETSIKELRQCLLEIFKPQQKDCYQEVLVLPALDEIKLDQDKVTLIISEPHADGIDPQLKKFYDDQPYKNRLLFLSGAREILDSILEASREKKAIDMILAEMKADKVSDNDPQMVTATELLDKIHLRLLSAAREAFTSLFYPHENLMQTDFLMNFSGNSYKGEEQIRAALKGKMKFTEDVSGDSFRKKCEERLFTQKAMPWNEIFKRAATNPKWQWHHPSALLELKADAIHRDIWRENGGFIEKGPFPPPATSVQIQYLGRNEDTGEATLRLTPVNGDVILYEIGQPATEASSPVKNPQKFITSEMNLSFLCIDSKKKHTTGEPKTWLNNLTVKSRQFQNGNQIMAELQAAPQGGVIKYSTDGSDPRTAGAIYQDPFPIPKGTVCLLAVAENQGIWSEQHHCEIDWEGAGQVKIQPDIPAVWSKDFNFKTTNETYEFLGRMKKFNAQALDVRLQVSDKSWVELSVDPNLGLSGEQLEQSLEQLRKLVPDGQTAIELRKLRFKTGQNLLDWVADARTEINAEEVKQ